MQKRRENTQPQKRHSQKKQNPFRVVHAQHCNIQLYPNKGTWLPDSDPRVRFANPYWRTQPDLSSGSVYTGRVAITNAVVCVATKGVALVNADARIDLWSIPASQHTLRQEHKHLRCNALGVNIKHFNAPGVFRPSGWWVQLHTRNPPPHNCTDFQEEVKESTHLNCMVGQNA